MANETNAQQPAQEQGAPEALPAAGWYGDPNDAALRRYWDGSSWTTQVRPAVEGQDPLAHFPQGIGIGPAQPRSAARRTIDSARERGVLGPEDELQAVAHFFKYTPAMVLLILLGILPGAALIWALQRSCFLLVTQRHVIFTGWSLTGGEKAVADVLRLDRPVQLALSEEPKKNHSFGNRVALPPQASEFLGRQAVYAGLGNLADTAFRIARTPPERSE